MNYLWSYLAVAALSVTCFLLIFIILLQRGRGGGLAGAFGGAGGQSALGTKAGDVFTKITVGLAVFWVLLACLSIYALRAESDNRLQLGTGDENAPAVESVAGDEGTAGDELDDVDGESGTPGPAAP